MAVASTFKPPSHFKAHFEGSPFRPFPPHKPEMTLAHHPTGHTFEAFGRYYRAAPMQSCWQRRSPIGPDSGSMLLFGSIHGPWGLPDAVWELNGHFCQSSAKRWACPAGDNRRFLRDMLHVLPAGGRRRQMHELRHVELGLCIVPTLCRTRRPACPTANAG